MICFILSSMNGNGRGNNPESHGNLMHLIGSNFRAVLFRSFWLFFFRWHIPFLSKSLNFMTFLKPQYFPSDRAL